jgi:hypothetical protein
VGEKRSPARPAEILRVKTQGGPRHSVHQALPAMICPQTSVKVVVCYCTAVDHALAPLAAKG